MNRQARFPPVLRTLQTFGNGSLIFTLRNPLSEAPKISHFISDALFLEVSFLRDDEALQLLQRKLHPDNASEAYSLLKSASWLPLSVGLAAASFDLGLPSESISPKLNKIPAQLENLFNSINPSSKEVLCFIGFFQPSGRPAEPSFSPSGNGEISSKDSIS